MDNLNKPDDLHELTNILLSNIRKIERYSPELTVEHKHPRDEQANMIDEQTNINQENYEELSDKNRPDYNV